MKTTYRCLLATAVLLVATSVQAAPTIINGSFEANGANFSTNNGYNTLGGNDANPTWLVGNRMPL